MSWSCHSVFAKLITESSIKHILWCQLRPISSHAKLRKLILNYVSTQCSIWEADRKTGFRGFSWLPFLFVIISAVLLSCDKTFYRTFGKWLALLYDISWLVCSAKKKNLSCLGAAEGLGHFLNCLHCQRFINLKWCT